MAWGIPFAAILAGAVLVLPSSHLQPGPFINIIRKEQVNKANGVPTLWLGVYAALKKNAHADYFPLKELLIEGASAPPGLIKNFQKDFGVKVVHAWGMTETSPVGTVSRLQPHHDSLSDVEKIKLRAMQGQEVPCIEIRAVLENGMIAPRDRITTGEIEIRGAWVIDSYFKLNSRENFSEDGWFKTGDVGVINAEAYMQITDRAKDLIKSGGEWISSVALEVAIMSHPKVKEVSVIAIPDELWSERPLAVIVLKELKETLSNEELHHFLSPSFAKYQLPDKMVFIEEIPKTSVGKFNKKRCGVYMPKENCKMSFLLADQLLASALLFSNSSFTYLPASVIIVYNGEIACNKKVCETRFYQTKTSIPSFANMESGKISWQSFSMESRKSSS